MKRIFLLFALLAAPAAYAQDADKDGWRASDGDCDDTNAAVYPGAVETCDGVDEDCDESIDEDLPCNDDDGDGWSEDDGDCDDADRSVSPDAVEWCDGEDENCNGEIDDGACGPESDEDADGWTIGAGDCNDRNWNVYPGAEDIWYDGVDSNCDDNDFDQDYDGADWRRDCDDTDSSIGPYALEVPDDGIDQDCSGYDAEAHLAGSACVGCHNGPGPVWPAAAALVSVLIFTRLRRRDGGAT